MMSTGKIMKNDLYTECNGDNGAQKFLEATCCICLQNLIPLFPADTELKVDSAIVSFKDIYAALTQINLDENATKSPEICLPCFRSIVNAFLTVKEKSDEVLKDGQGKEIKGISRKNTKSKVLFLRDDDDIKSSVQNPVNNVAEEKEPEILLSTKDILEKRNQLSQKLNKDQKSETIFRCKYCQNLFFSTEIKSHAKICPPPKKENIIKSENTSTIINESIKVAVSSTTFNESCGNTKLKENLKQEKSRSVKASDKVLLTNNKSKRDELVLQCKLCKTKLYVSQMEEHKMICRPKIVKKNKTEAENGNGKISNADKKLENSSLSEKPKIPPEKKNYKCQLCGKQCLTENLLMMHIMKHAKSHQCHVCSRTFSTAELLSEHKRKHYTSKKHICKICNKGFSCLRNLRSHMAYHEMQL